MINQWKQINQMTIIQMQEIIKCFSSYQLAKMIYWQQKDKSTKQQTENKIKLKQLHRCNIKFLSYEIFFIETQQIKMQKITKSKIINCSQNIQRMNRPQTSHIKHQTSSQIFNIFPQDIIMQKIKYILPNNNTQDSINLSEQVCSQSKNQQNVINCIEYHRGYKIQRNYYSLLLNKLVQFQQILPSIKTFNIKQIISYKKKYINQSLVGFFQIIGKQCQEKWKYLIKLWNIIKNIFQQLINRLITQLNINKKYLYNQCIVTHENYQNKFRQFQQKLNKKNQQLDMFKNIVTKISKKNKKKCRKNRQISFGMTQIVYQLNTLQKQRNHLQSQYINMLTLGYRGGMQYEQAKRYTINKFGIQKSLDLSYRPNNMSKKLNKSQRKTKLQSGVSVAAIFGNGNDGKQVENGLLSNSDKIQQISSNQQQDEQNIQQKVFLAKQKFVYGSNRYSSEFDELESEDDDYVLNLMKSDKDKCEKRKRKVQRLRISQKKSTENKIQEMNQNEQILKKCQNEEISTNFGNEQRYDQKLIEDKEVQTQRLNYAILQHENYQTIGTQCGNGLADIQNTNSQTLDKKRIKQKASNRFSLTYQLRQFTPPQNSNNSLIHENQIIYNKQIEQRSQQSSLKSSISQSLDKKSKLTQKIQLHPKILNNKINTPKNINQGNKIGRQSAMLKRKSQIISFSNGHHNRLSRRDVNKNIQLFQDQYKNNLANKRQSINKYNRNSKITANDQQYKANMSISDLSDKDVSQNEHEQDTGYLPTNMFSTVQNMVKLNNQGISMDESMLFVLEKYLFKIKHQQCTNVLKKNSKLIRKVREKVAAMGNVKRQALISVKGVKKIIGAVYDFAFRTLNKHQKMIQSLLPPDLSNMSNGEVHPIANYKDSLFTNPSSTNLKQQSSQQIRVHKQINLLYILQKCIQKQYPMYKIQQIQQKIIKITKQMLCEQNKNYMIKNFMMLSCLEDSILSPMIFSSDVEFYFYLLVQLKIDCLAESRKYINRNIKLDKNKSVICPNKQNKQYKEQSSIIQQNMKQIKQLKRDKSYKLHTLTNSYDNYYTNSLQLKKIFTNFINKFYKKQSLINFIKKRIEISLQKIQQKMINFSNYSDIRLDIFKCCQLIMQSIFSFKLTTLKSYTQLTQTCGDGTNYHMTLQLFNELIQFGSKKTLDKLIIINLFKNNFINHKNYQGISLIEMVNFCLHQNIQDFDQIIYQVIRKYPVNQQIQKNIQNMDIFDKRYNKIGKICMKLYQGINKRKSNKVAYGGRDANSQRDNYNMHKKQQSAVLNVTQRNIKKLTRLRTSPTHRTSSHIFDETVQNVTTSQIEPFCPAYKNLKSAKSKDLNPPQMHSQKNESVNKKQLVQIIGWKASYNLIHYRVVELATEEIMEFMLGKDLILVFQSSLNQLQEKKGKGE